MKSVIDTIGGFGTYFGLPTIFLKLVEKESYICHYPKYIMLERFTLYYLLHFHKTDFGFNLLIPVQSVTTLQLKTLTVRRASLP